MVGTVLSLRTIANDCFGVNSAGVTERTASFGGPVLAQAPAVATPSISTGMTLG